MEKLKKEILGLKMGGSRAVKLGGGDEAGKAKDVDLLQEHAKKVPFRV